MRNVVRYWRLVELFSPQKVDEPDPKNNRRPVVQWRHGHPLPWQYLPPAGRTLRHTLVWQHTVYFGVYRVEGIYEFLHRVFPQDEDAYDERSGGRSACAAVAVDGEGRLVAGSEILSSALWGIGRTTDPGIRNPLWLEGFDDAQRAFSKAVIDYQARVKWERRLSEDPPVDGEMMSALLDLAHCAAGIAGIETLGTTTVHIASTRVRQDRAAELPGYDFLNSFFLDELGKAIDSDWGAALTAYLTRDDCVPVDARVDVRGRPQAVIDGTSIDRLPPGRWMSNPHHPLATSQQFGVNEILNTLGSGSGLLGINGPPGTGKTTLLRDVLAGNIVRRAQALARLRHPDEAFVGPEHRWKSGDYPRRVRQLRTELTGFEMVVASSNNAAVANVSDELPRRTQIHRDWATTDHFGDLATEVARRMHDDNASPERAWGLIAARLGKKANRNDFNSAFWFGSGTQSEPHDPGADVVHGMQQMLKNWEADPTSRPSWREARVAFEDAQRRVEAEVDQRRAAAGRRARLAQVRKLTDRSTRQRDELDDLAPAVHRDLELAQQDLRLSRAMTGGCIERRQRHVDIRPGLWEKLSSFGSASKVWRTHLATLNNELDAAERVENSARQRAVAIERRTSSMDDARVRLDQDLRTLADEHEWLAKTTASDAEHYGSCYPGIDWYENDTVRELHGAWSDPALNRVRSDLFAAALELHRSFLANASRIRQDMMASLDVMTGAVPADLDSNARRAAWQVFFMVVPLVSTTFASVGRMFDGLGREALGWLLIDEAGQATPQAAVGAIWRARRVVAVGDPMQLTPVVTIPRRAQHDLAKQFDIDDAWIPSYTSVQGLADRVGKFGTTLSNGPNPVWVSAPLRVHRRCDSPMFDISNAVAYEGMMINGVHRDDHEFGAPPSQWLHVDADNPGNHLQMAEVRRLHRELTTLFESGISPNDIIAISPFRAVAAELSRVSDAFPGMTGGTIHTAQGREADIVFLVLGGDPQKPGAKRWASRGPNLVNVAASRAKRRLYVIGDETAWSRFPYFDTVASMLTHAK